MAPRRSLLLCLLASASLLSPIAALDAQLVGTWTTKSAKVLTGPGFYDPKNDSFTEPSLTGFSYSFTADGFYEEAYYQTIANPAKPSCPKAFLQFQHGQVTENADGSLLLIPFAVDGRQLMSDPCEFSNGIFTRYNQTETFEKFAVSKDAYTGVMRLDLFQFDGSPMNVMYMAYNPPMMLPTSTLNPVATSTPKGKSRRSLEQVLPLNKDAKHIKRETGSSRWAMEDTELMWWVGVGMTVLGGAAYLL